MASFTAATSTNTSLTTSMIATSPITAAASSVATSTTSVATPASSITTATSPVAACTATSLQTFFFFRLFLFFEKLLGRNGSNESHVVEFGRHHATQQVGFHSEEKKEGLQPVSRPVELVHFFGG